MQSKDRSESKFLIAVVKRLYGFEEHESYLEAKKALQDEKQTPEMQFRFRKKVDDECLGDPKDHKSVRRSYPYTFDETHVYDMTLQYERENSVWIDVWIKRGYNWSFFNPNAHLRVVLPQSMVLGREMRVYCPLKTRREASKGCKIEDMSSHYYKGPPVGSAPGLEMIFICFDPNNIRQNLLSWRARVLCAGMRSELDILSFLSTSAVKSLLQQETFRKELENIRNRILGVESDEERSKLSFRSKMKEATDSYAKLDSSENAYAEEQLLSFRDRISSMQNMFKERHLECQASYLEHVASAESEANHFRTSHDLDKNNWCASMAEKKCRTLRDVDDKLQSDLGEERARFESMCKAAYAKFERDIAKEIGDVKLEQASKLRAKRESVEKAKMLFLERKASTWKSKLDVTIRAARDESARIISALEECEEQALATVTGGIAPCEDESKNREFDDLDAAVQQTSSNMIASIKVGFANCIEKRLLRLSQVKLAICRSTESKSSRYDHLSDSAKREVEKRFEKYRLDILRRSEEEIRIATRNLENERSYALERQRRTTLDSFESAVRAQNSNRCARIDFCRNELQENVSEKDSPVITAVALPSTPPAKTNGTAASENDTVPINRSEYRLSFPLEDCSSCILTFGNVVSASKLSTPPKRPDVLTLDEEDVDRDDDDLRVVSRKSDANLHARYDDIRKRTNVVDEDHRVLEASTETVQMLEDVIFLSSPRIHIGDTSGTLILFRPPVNRPRDCEETSRPSVCRRVSEVMAASDFPRDHSYEMNAHASSSASIRVRPHDRVRAESHSARSESNSISSPRRLSALSLLDSTHEKDESSFASYSSRERFVSRIEVETPKYSTKVHTRSHRRVSSIDIDHDALVDNANDSAPASAQIRSRRVSKVSPVAAA